MPARVLTALHVHNTTRARELEARPQRTFIEALARRRPSQTYDLPTDEARMRGQRNARRQLGARTAKRDRLLWQPLQDARAVHLKLLRLPSRTHARAAAVELGCCRRSQERMRAIFHLCPDAQLIARHQTAGRMQQIHVTHTRTLRIEWPLHTQRPRVPTLNQRGPRRIPREAQLQLRLPTTRQLHF